MLREQAKREAETRSTTAPTAGALYAELTQLYRFTMPAINLRVAINGEFVAMDTPLSDGAEVTFIPPVAGG
ncbi:MoaD/ThiS family protein [bacterium]|nr:MoaD/ThiS family protein [bacterium]